ncbi:MAG: TMEM165/GDT1 family protein [Microcystaceae cyanobacterium]
MTISSDLAIADPLTESSPRTKRPVSHFRSVFFSTFLTIFFAEMGDKTQLSTLLISAESRSPWVVFAGSALALVATSLLGVSIGYWIARRLSPKILNFSVALLLLFITGLLIGDVLSY